MEDVDEILALSDEKFEKYIEILNREIAIFSASYDFTLEFDPNVLEYDGKEYRRYYFTDTKEVFWCSWDKANLIDMSYSRDPEPGPGLFTTLEDKYQKSIAYYKKFVMKKRFRDYLLAARQGRTYRGLLPS